MDGNEFAEGDTVQAKYVDALSRVLVMRGTVGRYDPELGKYWVALPIGISLAFTTENLQKV